MKIKEDFFKWAVVALSLLLIGGGFLKWQRGAVSRIVDMKLYYSVSTQLHKGKIPYRDFTIEYPPLALVPMVIPYVVSFNKTMDFGRYSFLYTLESLLVLLLFAFMLVQIAKHLTNYLTIWKLLTIFLLLAILSYDFLLWRYDLFPALLTVLTLLAVLRKQPLRAGIWLGLAISAKLYPVILVPVLMLYYLTGKQYRRATSLLAGSGLAVLLVFLPIMIVSDNRAFSFLTYHQLRGLQIESTAAGLLLLRHLPDLSAVSTEFNYGAFHLVAAGVGPVLKVIPWLFLTGFSGLMALCFFRFRREYSQTGKISVISLLTYLVAVLLFFIVSNKVFSPQYLLWLLPFILFFPVRQIAMVSVIFLLTYLIYSVFYSRLIDPTFFGVALLNLRNLLIIVLLIQLLKKPQPLVNQKEVLQAA